MTAILILGLLTSALFYLGSSAKITQPIWVRYPAWLDELMLCPWCVGFWWGAVVGFYYRWRGVHFISRGWDEVFVCALLGVVLTPIVSGLAFYFYLNHIPQKSEDEINPENDGYG